MAKKKPSIDENPRPTDMREPITEKNPRPMHENHRQRVYAEIAEVGLDHLPNHRVLEYILFFVIKRGDTNPLAHRLIQHFGSLAGVLEAEEEQLLEIEGVGPATARYLHALSGVARYYVSDKGKKNTRLATVEVRAKYLLNLFRGERKEVFYMVALDERANLIRPILIGEGASGVADVSIPRLVHEAAVSNASSVILAHNHPNKLPIPSQSDVVATATVQRSLGILGVRVLDHFVIANEEYYSMFEKGVFPYYNAKTGELRYY